MIIIRNISPLLEVRGSGSPPKPLKGIFYLIMEINTFIMFKSFVNGIRQFDDKTIAEAFLAYADYALEGKLPETDNPVVKLALESHMPNIDAAKLRYVNCTKNGMKGKKYGKLGGRPRKGESKEEYKERKKIDNETENKPLQKPLQKPLTTEEEITPRKPLQKPLYIDKDIDNDKDTISSSTSNIYNLNNLNNKNINKEKEIYKEKENLINIDKEVISSTSTSKDDNDENIELQKQIVKNCKILLNCKIKRKMNIDEQDVYDDTIKLFEQVYNIDEISSKEKIKSYINFLYNKISI